MIPSPTPLFQASAYLLSFLLIAAPVLAQEDSADAESKFVGVGDVRLHYLDFGGEGLPIIFIHGVARGAQTWAGFAPRFTDFHHVLALTARGVGESEGEQSVTEIRAGDILGFMDALGIERAVLMGNSGPGRDMTFISEHAPERVAGLVFLANVPPTPGLDEVDPSGGMQMAARATRQSFDDEQYQPRFVDDPDFRMQIPALTFVTKDSGYRGWENFPMALMVADRAIERGTGWIQDPEAKAFFERAASDEAFREEIRSAWEGTVLPAFRRHEEAFRESFGDKLQMIELDLPFVTGYEYLRAPELIESHVHAFLEPLRSQKAARSR